MTPPLTLADLAALLSRAAGIPSARALAILEAAPLQTLVRETPDSLRSRYKLTPKQAGGLHAGLTLGRLTCGPDLADRLRVTTPRQAAEYLIPHYGHLPTEHFGILSLDTKRRLLATTIISVGSLDSTLVHPREVYRAALDHRAASILVFHNHPSGDPTPSADDLALTNRLRAAGEVLGVDLQDHLIVTDTRYYSFQEAGR